MRAPMVSQLADNHLFVRLNRSRDYLRASLDRPVSLAEAAREACLSKYHYLRLFQQAFGETPHDFLVRSRMEQARSLLLTGEMPITEICFEVGYESLGSFSTRFHRFAGYSPSEFRRHARPRVVCPGFPRLLWVPSCLAFE